MSNGHAYLPPSGAAEIVACAAWAKMNHLYPQPETDDTRNGTAAHWAGVELHLQRPVSIGSIAPNGVTIDDEILSSAEVYAQALHGHTWHLEHTIQGRSSMNWGTPDAFRREGHVIPIKDFKHGHGFVDEFENWQLINYAMLLMEAWAIDGLQEQSIVFELTIIQPRAYHKRGPVRTWRVPATDLRAYWNQLRAAHERALQPDAKATPGPQCEHCSGRHACPALQQVGGRIAQHAGDATPVDLPPAALGLELHLLTAAQKMLTARITGLQAQVEAHLRRGERIGGWALESGEAREMWTLPTEQVIAIAAAMGVSVSKPGILTPRQAREAGLDPKMVAGISTRPPGAMKLVRDDGSLARKVFG